MIAVVVVRDGQLPSGGDEAVAECHGRAVLIGSGVTEAAQSLAGVASHVIAVETGSFQPGAYAAHLAPLLAAEPSVLLPGSPDGRDLAPRLAALLHRPLFAGAIKVSATAIELTRMGSTEIHEVTPGPAFIATLQPGVRGVTAEPGAAMPSVERVAGAVAGGVAASPPPIVSSMWHVAVNGQSQGPYAIEQVVSAIAAGQVTKSTLVWTAGMANWAAAGSIPQLAGSFGPPAPPPMPAP